MTRAATGTKLAHLYTPAAQADRAWATYQQHTATCTHCRAHDVFTPLCHTGSALRQAAIEAQS